MLFEWRLQNMKLPLRLHGLERRLWAPCCRTAWKPERQQTDGKLTVAVVANTFRCQQQVHTDYSHSPEMQNGNRSSRSVVYSMMN